MWVKLQGAYVDLSKATSVGFVNDGVQIHFEHPSGTISVAGYQHDATLNKAIDRIKRWLDYQVLEASTRQ